MPGIMGDHDCLGQFEVIRALLESRDYEEFFATTNLAIMAFKDLDLAITASDALVWQTCQDHEIVLVTGNRNDDSSDSLEATLRTKNTAQSLPVITIANPRLVMEKRSYAIRVVERLLDYLMDLENYRGAGRLYVP